MPLVGECFQYVREPTNEEDAISVACNNFHSKEEVVDLVQPKSPWLILFLLHLHFGHFCNWETRQPWW